MLEDETAQQEPIPPAEHWPYILQRYRDLVEIHGWRFKPMLALAEELSISEDAHTFYLWTSHEHLGFSTVGTYPEVRDVPVVWVSYLRDAGTFRVQYREKGRDRTDPGDVEAHLSHSPSEVRQVLPRAF